MSPNNTTLHEVARLAGVSVSTVSRVLTPERRHLVNDETAKRVEEAIQTVRYSPNSLARGLKTRRSLTVGVLIPDLRNPVFPPMLRGIEERLARDDYTPLIVNTDNDPAREHRAFEKLQARQVDGFILATTIRNDEVIDRAIAVGAPVVLLNRTVSDGRVHAVVPNDRHGMRLAVEHLVELGHTAIGHVAGPSSTSSGQRRREGFRAAMRRHGLAAPRPFVQQAAAFTAPAGREAARKLLDGGKPLTAIVAGNDLLALGCYDALQERGLRCPDDVSIVGFNNMPFADRFNPPLTTLYFPHEELGRIAAQLLVGRLGPDPAAQTPREVMVEPSLVIRGSTAPLESNGRRPSRDRRNGRQRPRR